MKKVIAHRSATVIRFENAGCIIWSPNENKYFLLEQSFRNLFYDAIINKGLSVLNAADKIPALRNALEHLGVDDFSMVLDNTNRSKRPMFAPLECYFDFTTRCNMHCRDCYNNKVLGNATMGNEDIVRIITDLWNVGLRRIFVAGGEPTLEMEGLMTYINAAVDLGMATSVATNGTLLTDDICRYLLSKPLFDISVSIDGWDEQTYGYRRTAHMFQKATEGVRRLVEIKKEYGSQTEICVKPIVDRYQTVEFFENMIALTIELGADKVKFANPERSLNHPRGHYGNDVEKYYDNIHLIQSLQAKYKDKIAVTNGTNPCVGFGLVGVDGMKGCIGGQELIAINGDGRITPCLMNHKILGNYYDNNSMIHFFETSSELNEFIDQIQYPQCYDCMLYPRCRGGCQVRKIVECGEMAGRDPICPITHKMSLDKLSVINKELLMPIRVVHSL